MTRTRVIPNRPALDIHRPVSSADLARAAVRYALTDVHAAGADTGLGLPLAHAECPGSFSDVTEADIDAMLAGVGQ